MRDGLKSGSCAADFDTYLHILGQKNEGCAARRGVAFLCCGHWRLETLVRDDSDHTDKLAGLN